MAHSLDQLPRHQQSKMSADSLRLRGEGYSKPLAVEERRWLGQVIERALDHADLTKQAATDLLGYENQSTLSRWISGVDIAPVHALFDRLGHRFQVEFITELSLRVKGAKERRVVEFERTA